MATAPIRSQAEITTIINKAQNTLADLGYDIVGDGKRGDDLTEVGFRDKVYRLILLRAYLKNLIDPNTGSPRLYYSATANKLALNNILNALVALSDISATSGGIPRILSPTGTVVYYPSSSGPSGGGQGSSGGPAAPGGVTFQNVSVSSPGEVVDVLDAANNDYAFYIIRVSGSGSGEGSRLDIVGVNWRNASTPVITTYRGDGVGGTVPVTVYYSAAIVSGQMQLTCNVPTDGWNVKGTRISFENISFQNAQGPLPSGGTVGQYLRKSSSTDFDAAFAAILMSEVTGLATALNNRLLLAGGTMTGPINMGSNKITSLDDGTSAGDAVNKGQLDGKATDVYVDIGVWDMDSSVSKTTAHGQTYSKIKDIHVWINRDGATLRYKLNSILQAGGSLGGGFYWDATNIYMERVTGGFFDSTEFNDGNNRGVIHIELDPT